MTTETPLKTDPLPPVFQTMALEYIATALLQTYPRQLRKHTSGKIRKLARFMQQSGVIMPLVVDKDNFVVLGNARLAALRLLGVESVQVIRVTHLDETMIRALILADSQFTMATSWYKEALREELMYLAPLVLELGLELDLTIGDQHFPGAEDIPTASGPAVTQLGDVWLLDRHKLICGDAREESIPGTQEAGRQRSQVLSEVQDFDRGRCQWRGPLAGSKECRYTEIRRRYFQRATRPCFKRKFPPTNGRIVFDMRIIFSEV
jgi:hypothetical protein